MINLILLSLIIGYGIVLGVRNSYMRVCGWFGRAVAQSTFGKLLDVTWYAMIIFWFLK
jgi:hypothetical protein